MFRVSPTEKMQREANTWTAPNNASSPASPTTTTTQTTVRRYVLSFNTWIRE